MLYILFKLYSAYNKISHFRNVTKCKKITANVIFIKSYHSISTFSCIFFPVLFSLFIIHLSWNHTVSVMGLDAIIQNIFLGPEELAQWSKALTAFTEVWDLIPSTHMVMNNHP